MAGGSTGLCCDNLDICRGSCRQGESSTFGSSKPELPQAARHTVLTIAHNLKRCFRLGLLMFQTFPSQRLGDSWGCLRPASCLGA